MKRDIAYRKTHKNNRFAAWVVVTADEVVASKRPGERFRDILDFDLQLRHHGGRLTPHFEIEPRWNTKEQRP
jgi:hypothetical protein